VQHHAFDDGRFRRAGRCAGAGDAVARARCRDRRPLRLCRLSHAKDRNRTEANARGQCKQPFVIGQGTAGGVVMPLADTPQPQELRLKGSSAGKDISAGGETPGPQDREIVSFDGRVLILKYVDPEIDGRYGTGVFVRCAPRA